MDKLKARIDLNKNYTKEEIKQLRIELIDEFDKQASEFKRLNDQTYTDCSDHIESNAK